MIVGRSLLQNFKLKTKPSEYIINNSNIFIIEILNSVSKCEFLYSYREKIWKQTFQILYFGLMQ